MSKRYHSDSDEEDGKMASAPHAEKKPRVFKRDKEDEAQLEGDDAGDFFENQSAFLEQHQQEQQKRKSQHQHQHQHQHQQPQHSRNFRQEKEVLRERKKNRVEMAIEKNRSKERRPVGGGPHGAPSGWSGSSGSSGASDASSGRDAPFPPAPKPPAKPGVHYHVAVALPGSILNLAQSAELKTYMAGQIARYLALYSVDEIVIYNDGTGGKQASSSVSTTEGEFESASKTSSPELFLARILQYLETPQYLRKQLFPRHPDLTFAGLLAPLETPHHPKIDDLVEFREGIIIDKPVKSSGVRGRRPDQGDSSDNGEEGRMTSSREPSKRSAGSFANVGMRQDAKVNVCLQPGTRVTVRFDNWGPDFDPLEDKSRNTVRHPYGQVVSPQLPRTLRGLYWGYSVRLESCLSDALRPPEGDRHYDLCIGVGNEDADSVDELKELPEFSSCIIVFGGVSGTKSLVESDESTSALTPRQLFPIYINTCPDKGARSIRPEESLLVTLACLSPMLRKSGNKKKK